MAIHDILSGCRSARNLERFAWRHHQASGVALDLELTKAPCDSTFLYLVERMKPEQLFGLFQEWMLAQIAQQNKDVNQLICGSKTMRGSAAQLDGADGATRCVAQVTLDARELGVAIAQTSFDTSESHERAAHKALLNTHEFDGVLIQADGLHTSSSCFNTPPSRALTFT